MTLAELWPALEKLPWSIAIKEGGYLFPAIESLHVLAITLVVGTITIVDLRLLGLPNREKGVRQLTKEVLPYTWAFFVLAVISGLLMFVSRATVYAGAAPFQVKIGIIFLAGLNTLVFHLFQYRSVDRWDRLVQPPLAAKIAGAVSLCIWMAVIVLGRWTGFVTS